MKKKKEVKCKIIICWTSLTDIIVKNWMEIKNQNETERQQQKEMYRRHEKVVIPHLTMCFVYAQNSLLMDCLPFMENVCHIKWKLARDSLTYSSYGILCRYIVIICIDVRVRYDGRCEQANERTSTT